MPDLIRTARRWWALAALAPLPLTWPASSVAQAPAPATAAERAQRDAERVFEFIKFHTLRPRMIEPSRAAKPAAPAPPPAPTASERASPLPRPVPAEPPVRPAAGLAATELPPTLEAAPVTAPVSVAVPVVPAALPVAPAALPPAAPAAPDPDDGDDDALQLQSFVAPTLPPAVQATLGAGSRNIKVRFTVETDGRVSQAEAAAGVPRRLARPATDAILQWRFAPLPQPRTVDVEIAFRRD